MAKHKKILKTIEKYEIRYVDADGKVQKKEFNDFNVAFNYQERYLPSFQIFKITTETYEELICG